MSNKELQDLKNTLDEIASLAGKANKVFAFVKYLVWSVVGLGGVIAGSGVWVYATNLTLKQHAETIATMVSENKTNFKELSDWRRAKDEIDIRLTDAIVNVSDALKMHMRYTDPKSVLFDTEGLKRDLKAAASASRVRPPDDPPANPPAK